MTTDSGGASRIPQPRLDIDNMSVIYSRTLSNTLAYRYRLVWCPRLYDIIRRELAGCDILHIHELRSSVSVSGYNAARALSKPYVISTHGGLRHLGRKAAKVVFDALWGSRILRHAAAVIAVSPIEEKDAVAMNVNPERIRRLPNALSLNDYDPLPPRGAFRKKHDLGEGKVILFLGRLHWVKGADLLIRAFRKISPRFAKATLIIAGPDDGQEKELRRLAEEEKANRILFTGYLDHEAKVRALVDSDAVVVPSRSEVFALTAIEALTCGVPVLVSSACGLHPMPTLEEGLAVFESENTEDLALKLQYVLENNQGLRNASRARDFVLREFSSDAIAHRAIGIYREAVGSGS